MWRLLIPAALALILWAGHAQANVGWDYSTPTSGGPLDNLAIVLGFAFFGWLGIMLARALLIRIFGRG